MGRGRAGMARPLVAARQIRGKLFAWWYAQPGSNRHSRSREIFLPLQLSLPLSRSWSGLCLGPGLRVRPPPSSLYTFPFPGFARRCLGCWPGGSPNLTGFTRAFSRPGAQIFKSLVSTNFTMGATRDILKAEYALVQYERCAEPPYSRRLLLTRFLYRL